MMISKPIKFNSNSKEFRELSNFYISTFFLDSEKWPSVEHYFQANKFTSPDTQEKIRNLATPNEAKKLGKLLNPLRDDWEEKKIAIMYKAVHAKFEQNGDLKKILQATKDRELYEISIFDRFWAVGKKLNGRNELGKILMKVRSELRSEL